MKDPFSKKRKKGKGGSRSDHRSEARLDRRVKRLAGSGQKVRVPLSRRRAGTSTAEPSPAQVCPTFCAWLPGRRPLGPPRLLLLQKAGLQLLDLLVIVLPLGDDSHSCFQLGLFGHWIITLETKKISLAELKKGSLYRIQRCFCFEASLGRRNNTEGPKDNQQKQSHAH